VVEVPAIDNKRAAALKKVGRQLILSQFASRI